MVYQPDVMVETSTEVDYDPSWVTQPEIEIVSVSEIGYSPPASSGGQPSITIVTHSNIAFTPPLIYTDTEGHTNIRFTTSGAMDVAIDPVAVPVGVEMENVRRVSVTMPRPEALDRFGRPVQ